MTIINDTADRIKHKAHALFMQYGLRSVSMDDIAGGLGMSKKTIYQFYQDKDALVDDVITTVINHNQFCCDNDKLKSQDAIHEIFLAIDMMLEMFKSMNPSILFDMHKYYPKAFQIFLKHRDDYLFGIIKDNIKRGIEEGLYRAELKIEVMARFRVESMMLPFNPDFQSKVKESLVGVEEEITLHFLYGLVSPKGYKLALKYLENRNSKQS
jgi:TetR/AcrR family transcriptional regulator, cholesterol catabolism regulator